MARAALLIAGTVISLFGLPRIVEAQGVQECPDPNGCAQLSIGSASGAHGDTVRVGLTLQKGPNDGHAGGLDEIAALAATLLLGTGAGTPLTLADCTLDANGVPAAIKPDPAISGFNVVIENASCANGRTHCLCPDPVSGIIPDSFINLAIYGPNPLPPPGVGMVTIPILPDGQLLSVDLKIGASARGAVLLHLLNQWNDSQHPVGAAFLSIGDALRTDQTCVPIAGSPPCSSAGSVSQVIVSDGSIVLAATPTAILTLTPTLPATPTPSTATPPAASTATRTPTQRETPTGTQSASATATGTATATPTATATFTATATQTPTATALATATDTAIATATNTPPDTPTASVTVAATRTPIACVGDCNGSGSVTVDEILTMVSISLGNLPESACTAGDANGDGAITIDEVLTAVQSSLNGCSSTQP